MDALGEQRAGLRVGAGVDQRQQLRNRRARAGGSIAVTSSQARNTRASIGESAAPGAGCQGARALPRAQRPRSPRAARAPTKRSLMRLYGCVGVPLAVHSPLALWIGGEDGFDDGKRRCDEEGVDQDQGNAGEHGDSLEPV